MSSRPPVFTWNEELHFGPPSEPIDIQMFLDEAQDLHSRGMSPWTPDAEPCTAISGWPEWQSFTEEVKASIEEDCNLEDDIESSLYTTLKSQKHMVYLQNLHATAVSELVPPPASGKKKAKDRKTAAESYDPELQSFKKTIQETPLKMWKLKSGAKPYIRPGHVSDQNSLDSLSLRDSDQLEDIPPLSHEVLITLTAYTRNTWYPYAFSRDAKHVLPSSYTLADVWSCIPCALRGDGNMPEEVIETDAPSDAFGHYLEPKERVVSYAQADSNLQHDHVVMVVEGIAYSDGRGDPDYADKLLSHLAAFKPSPADPDAPPPLPPGPYERPSSLTSLTKGLPVGVVPLRSLTLRVNEPYWVLHRGNCEHWFVVDEIRLQNSRDPTSGYPIGLQRTPLLRPLCRVCSKVPAALSVLNDVRLGESPGMVCQPCWDLFGGPPQPKEADSPADRVVVVPMVFETS